MSLQDNQTKFKVGDVVFFIASSSEKIIPALISEKIVRTSIDEELRVSYILRVHLGEKTKDIEVDPQKCALFATPEDVRSYMLKRTTTTIDHLISEAVRLSKVFKPEIKEQTAITPTPALTSTAPDLGSLRDFVEMESKPDGEEVMVDLGDGKVARLRMPQ